MKTELNRYHEREEFDQKNSCLKSHLGCR